MKKILVLGFLLTLLFSCNVDDDGVNYSFEILPVESVDIPNEFTLGETYPITVTYLRPSTCHSFHDFYYLKENNQRTVAVISTLFDRNNCQNLTDEVLTATFNFLVTSNGSYVFKFWQGEDENDENKHLTIEVPVTN